MKMPGAEAFHWKVLREGESMREGDRTCVGEESVPLSFPSFIFLARLNIKHSLWMSLSLTLCLANGHDSSCNRQDGQLERTAVQSQHESWLFT